MNPLGAEFFSRPVVEVAHDLIGCTVAHSGCSGIIVETEAYHESEPACHAFVGITPRTKTLFGPPGKAYVYRSYGIHALLNAVCEPEGVGAGVLIRALEPTHGLQRMRERRGVTREEDLCSGPGKLAQAVGVRLEHNGVDLSHGAVRVLGRDRGGPVLVDTSARIGISKAADVPWRFCLAGSRYLSAPRVRRSRKPRQP